MNTSIANQQDPVRINVDPLDLVTVGDWYWVKYPPTESKPFHEHLFCVAEIGSNYIEFGDSCHSDKVHFNEFSSRCRPEPNRKEALNKKMANIQKQIQAKTKQLVEHGQKLFLLELPEASLSNQQSSTLLPVKVADEPNRYKKDLLKLQEKTLPTISKEIDVLAKEFAYVAKDLALPDLFKLENIKDKLNVVEDRIFTIELYCGLQETVHQIAEGEPAPITEKIAIRQALLFMDEETLFDYKDGGMDFNSINKFDEWVVKPENLNRILPEQKSVVAFQVRRHRKDYGTPSNFLQAWTMMSWDDANKQTYLLLRNGQNVYRIVSEIDFSPRLIPFRNEIGAEQFKEINTRFDWEKKSHKETVKMITPDHVEFDEHVKKVDRLLKQYNRIVILIQGLLDRSKVFHPHPPINLVQVGQIDEWIRLIRDEEDGLPCNKINFDEYKVQLNKTLRVGKSVYIRYPVTYEKYRNSRTYAYTDPDTHKEVVLPRRSWNAKAMPQICKIDAMKRDKSAVYVSWPQGELSCGKRVWVPSTSKPGWGHYEHIYETDRMFHEWVPTKFVLNLTDYTQGDYKMFLCDRALKGKYLEWAPFLLTAEDFSRKNKEHQF